MIAFKLPELGENIETAEVTRLLVREGDTVREDQNVMELDSEKASFPLPCPYAGKIVKLRVKEGDTVKVGQTVLEIEEKAEIEEGARPEDTPAGELTRTASPESAPPVGAAVQDGAAEKQPAKKANAGGRRSAAGKRARPSRRKAPPASEAAQEQEAPNEESAPPSETAPVQRAAPVAAEMPAPPRRATLPAGPATRKLARELGVDLRQVQGSGFGGRISRDDVKTYVQARLRAAAPVGQVSVPPLPDFSRWGPVHRQRLNAIGRAAVSRLSLAWQQVPHVTQHDLADITELEAARRKYNQENQGRRPNITVTILCIHAVIGALKTQPKFNSSLDPGTGELILKDYHHIGVAVDTEQGLLVPVLRDADRKSMLELAAELADLAARARKRSLLAVEMEGGTFTVSNLGGIGGTAFTPIVNFPEVAILGISRAGEQPVYRDGRAEPRLMLPLSLSYDHRVINGADGARFLVKVSELLSGAFLMLAEA